MTKAAPFLFVVTILLFAARGNGNGNCRPPWLDCPGVINDVLIAPSASNLTQWVDGNVRHFRYYNRTAGTTGEGIASKECALTFRS